MSILDRIKWWRKVRRAKRDGYLILPTSLTPEDWDRVTKLWRKTKTEIVILGPSPIESIVRMAAALHEIEDRLKND